jgi:hypothetical protein
MEVRILDSINSGLKIVGINVKITFSPNITKHVYSYGKVFGLDPEDEDAELDLFIREVRDKLEGDNMNEIYNLDVRMEDDNCSIIFYT